MSLSARILAVILILPQISTSAARCFLPDGSKNDNDLPCFANDSLSRFCSPDELCDTKKLCVKTSNRRIIIFAPGSCLDQGFGSICPTFCRGFENSGKVVLFQCGDTTLRQFCCDEGGRGLGGGSGSSCCSNIITLGIGSAFSEGASKTIMTSVAKPPLVTLISIISRTTLFTQTSLRFVTSIVASQPPATSPVFLSHLSLTTTAPKCQTFSSLMSLASSFFVPSSLSTPRPTTILASFTDLPSPVFTSTIVPTSTLPPWRTSKTTTFTTSTSTSACTTPSSTSPSIVFAPSSSSSFSLSSSPATSTSTTAVPANMSRQSASKRVNKNAIIAGVLAAAIGLFLIIFFLLLLRHQRQKKRRQLVDFSIGKSDLPLSASGLALPGLRRASFGIDENRSILSIDSMRSGSSDSSNQTALGYKPERKVVVGLERQDSDESATSGGMGGLSVSIVYWGSVETETGTALRTPFARDMRGGSTTRSTSIRTSDIRSIEERLQRLPSTTSQSNVVIGLEKRRMTPGSDFNIYQSPSISMFEREEIGGSVVDKDGDSYIEERTLATFGYTPEDLNRVGGTGYGKTVVPVDISEMEGRIPENARMSDLSETGTTYRKLLEDERSQPF